MLKYTAHGVAFPVVTPGDVRAAAIAFPVIGFVLLLLRAAGHRMTKNKPGLADLFGWISWLFVLGMGAIMLWSNGKGVMGYPPSKEDLVLTETTISPYQRNFIVADYVLLSLMVLALGTTKLSILFFFRQMFSVNHRRFWDILTRVLIAIVVAWTIAFFLAKILVCGTHPSAQWHPLDIASKYCLAVPSSEAALNNTFSITDLILDICCITLPFPLIWNSNLQFKFKISITGAFLVGLASIAVSAVRTAVFIEVDDAPFGFPADNIYWVTMALQWAMIETGLSFIASQLPALGVYVTKLTMDRRANGMPSARDLISLQAISKVASESDVTRGASSTTDAE